MPDHAMPTTPDRLEKIDDPEARDQLAALIEYTNEFEVPYIQLADRRHGIGGRCDRDGAG